MADSNSLKVMCIFEIASRLDYSSELACLAAHIYHRFFRVKAQQSSHDLYVFALASLKLAHMFYELPINGENLCLVANNIIQGKDIYLSKPNLKKTLRSINLAAKVISTNLDYQINFRDTRMITPGLLLQQNREQAAEEQKNRKVPVVDISFSDDEQSSSSSSDDDDGGETKADRLLSKNDKHQIGSHRYLVHYLKTIKLLVSPASMEYFEKISNLAWTFLRDYHWTPCVTQVLSNHLACTCLMMAIEVYRPKLEKSQLFERLELWNLLNRKWNLIFCDDFPNKLLSRAINMIVGQYDEYDRVLQHELSTFVIDPLRR